MEGFGTGDTGQGGLVGWDYTSDVSLMRTTYGSDSPFRAHTGQTSPVTSFSSVVALEVISLIPQSVIASPISCQCCNRCQLLEYDFIYVNPSSGYLLQFHP